MKKLLFIVGVLFAGTALFAGLLGMDNDGGWGRGRILLLEAGIIFVLTGVAIHLMEVRLTTLFSKISVFTKNILSRPIQITMASLLAGIIVISVYGWIIQLNQRDAGQEYDYYIELAKSFKHGQLYLADQPSLELLSLENPYDYFLRRQKNIDDFPWDVSLYENRFYTYWGPVPALLLTVFSAGQLSRIGDFHVALVFAGGLFIYSALIAITFWQRSAQHSPAWLLGFLLLVIGISAPVTIMLKGAKIYEAAILGCQFFFIGGCYWAYSSVNENGSDLWRLAFAALHWTFAVGTRIIVLPAVFFCAVFTAVYILKSFKKNTLQARLAILATIAAPLALAGLGLAWYNWARFDSIFEFGLTYQLANIDYTNFQNLFSIQRIPQNIGLYFFHPIKIVPRFPYITRIEYLPSNDRLAGLIYLSPYLLLLLLTPMLGLIANRLSSKALVEPNTDKHPSENWALFALTGAGFFSTGLIMSYYFVAMRFMGDFMPTLVLLTTILLGREYHLLSQNNTVRKLLSIIALVLGIISITANLLVAVPGSGIFFMVNFLNSLGKLVGLRLR